MKNRITEILGSQYPIILGAMRFITLAKMAAAMSNAGGFGLIAASGMEAEPLRKQIRNARELTDNPLGINIPVYRPNAFEALEIAIEEGIKTITTSAGDAGKLIKRIKEAGIKVLHMAPTVEMAKKAEDAGVDAVIAVGTEAGGHVGRDEVSTLTLIPQVVDAVKIPVVAAGGIGDARGWVAVHALGAEGIQMGTRFLATEECPVPEVYKQAILAARDNSTMIAARKGFPLRALKNKAVMAIREMEEKGAGQEEINAFVDKLGSKHKNDPDYMLMPAGQVAGLTKEITTIEELIKRMVEGANRLSLELVGDFE
ncbi:MAG: nitronate monooxygenase [Desulfobacterales bacterium]|nr:nitronate monooxygenase [Desulfobacterales bacterium]